MGVTETQETAAAAIEQVESMGRDSMIPRIKQMEPVSDYCLYVVFDDGKTVLYDVKEDMRDIPSYRILETICGLFQQAKVDDSRTCIFWNEDIDLPSDIIYEYGKRIENSSAKKGQICLRSE